MTSNKFVWAIDTDGNLTKCTAKPENRGTRNCKHLFHQEEGQSMQEFMQEHEVASFSLSDLAEADPHAKAPSVFQQEIVEVSPYRMTDEEKMKMKKIECREDFDDDNEYGMYISLPYGVWNDMDKNVFAEMTGQKRKEIDALLEGSRVIVIEGNDEFPTGTIIEPREDENGNYTLEFLEDAGVAYDTKVMGLNAASEALGFEATKDIYVLPVYQRQGVVRDDGTVIDSPETELYKSVFNVKKNPDSTQLRYEALIDNKHARKPTKGHSGFPLKSLRDKMPTKYGAWRRELTGHNIPYTGSAVCTPSVKINYDQIAIPPAIAVDIFRPTIMKNLKQKGFSPEQINEIIADSKRPQTQVSQFTRSTLEKAIKEEGVKCLVNRSPSLHKGSLIAMNPIISDTPTIQTNPLINKNLNLDFDGDTSMLIGLNDRHISEVAERSMGMDTMMFMPRAQDVNNFLPFKDSKLGLMNILKARK